MKMYLSCNDPKILEEARSYLKNLPSSVNIKEEKSGKDFAEYSVDLPEEVCDALLNSLLTDFPKIDIYATIISDFDGRDRSFWSTTTYKSATNEDGKRYFEVSGSTGWA